MDIKKILISIIFLLFSAVSILTINNYYHHSVNDVLKNTYLSINFNHKIEDEFIYKKSGTKYIKAYKISFDEKYYDELLSSINSCNNYNDKTKCFSVDDSDALEVFLKNKKFSSSNFVKSNGLDCINAQYFSALPEFNKNYLVKSYFTGENVLIMIDNDSTGSNKRIAYIMSMVWIE